MRPQPRFRPTSTPAIVAALVTVLMLSAVPIAVAVGANTGAGAATAIITVDPAAPVCLDVGCTLPVVWQGWMTNPPGWLTPSGMIPFPGDRPSWWEPFMDLVDDLNVNRIAMVNIRPGIQSPADYWGDYVAGRPTPTPPPPLRNWFWDYRQGAPFQWTLLDKMMENLILPLRERLAARNEPLFVTFEYYNQSGGQFTTFRDNPDEFAEWVWAIWTHLDTKYGVTPDSFTINEPGTTGDRWSMEQVGAAISAIGARLAASGWHPRFGGPASERVTAAPRDFDTLIAQPGVASYLTDIEYHLYGGFRTSDLTAMIQRGRVYGKRVAMSEFLSARHDDLDALLRDGKISYFRQLGLGGLRCIPPTTTPGGATPTPAPCNPDQLGSLILVDAANNYRPFIQSEAWYLRQYMKFIHMNARAITATTQNANMHPVAFINPNGAPVVVVNVVSIATGGDFVIRGLPAGTYNIKYSVAGNVDHDLPPQTVGPGGEIATGIPAVGVITIYRNDVLIPTRTTTASRATATRTRAATPIPTNTPLNTQTRTRTRTPTPVNSIPVTIATRTVTGTPSRTSTFSPFPTITASNTPEATRTATPTRSNTVPTSAPSSTATGSPTRSASRVASTPTSAPSATAQSPPTRTLSRTPTPIPTNTATEAPSPTNHPEPTATARAGDALIAEVVRGIFVGRPIDLNGDELTTAADVTCAVLGASCGIEGSSSSVDHASSSRSSRG